MKKIILSLFVLIYFSSFVYANTCDWKVEILSENIFENKTEFEFKYIINKIEGNKTDVTLIRNIEDIYGEVIKSYNDYTKEITTKHTTSYLTPNLDEGIYLIKGEIFPDCNDTDMSNNIDFRLIIILSEKLGDDYSKIKINEFFPDPYGYDDALMPEGEWIELYNSGDNDLDLLGLILNDDYGNGITIADTNVMGSTIISAKDYLVVYRNRNGRLELNNDGFDKVKLYDSNNNLIDKVSYSDSKEGESFAKINGTWQITMPTPGSENIDNEEVWEPSLDIEKIYVGSDDKAKFGDNLRVKVEIYKGNSTKYSVQLWAEDDKGEEISKRTRVNIDEKYNELTLTLPVQLIPNCKWKWPNGTYTMVLKGLNERDEEEFEIDGITKSLCGTVFKESKSKETNPTEISVDNNTGMENLINKEENLVTGQTVYESTDIKAKRSAVYFFAGVLLLIMIAVVIKRH